MRKSVRRGALLFVGAAAMVGLAVPAAQAAPADAKPQVKTTVLAKTAAPAKVMTAAPPGYVFRTYYYWVNDCTSAGENGVRDGSWKSYQCLNGSWVPGDDYELWILPK